jgi:hypothetical protein
MSDLADELLTAHVEHELSRLRGDALEQLLEAQVGALFRWFEDVKFNEFVTRDQVVGVIERYVIELKVSGGITELAGQMSNVVFSSKMSAATRVEDICPPDEYEDFAEKVFGLERGRRELIRQLTRSPAVGALVSRVISRIVLNLVFPSDDGRTDSRLRGLVSAVEERLLPGLERRAAAALSRYIEQRARRLTRDSEKHLLEALDSGSVREIADEIWDAVSGKTLAEAASSFAAQDLEDFVVLGYEFWLKFRKTAYFRAVSSEVVDQLFAKYGDESVSSVIADMGVTERMVTHELQMFLGRLFDQARRDGFLEQQIRAYLEPFYRSPALKALLAR